MGFQIAVSTSCMTQTCRTLMGKAITFMMEAMIARLCFYGLWHDVSLTLCLVLYYVFDRVPESTSLTQNKHTTYLKNVTPIWNNGIYSVHFGILDFVERVLYCVDKSWQASEFCLLPWVGKEFQSPKVLVCHVVTPRNSFELKHGLSCGFRKV